MQLRRRPATRRGIVLSAILLLLVGAVAAYGYMHADEPSHTSHEYGGHDGYPEHGQYEDHDYDYGHGYSDDWSTSAQQHVYGNDGEVYVERSHSGDGTVDQQVKRTEHGVSVSQHVTRGTGHKTYPKDGESNNTADDAPSDGANGENGGNGSENGDDGDDGAQNGVGDENGQDNGTVDGDDAGADNGTQNDTDADGGSEDGTNDGANGSDGGVTPPIDDILDNETDDSADNGTDIGGNGASNEITDITPRSGSRILGDDYQTPPADTAEPPVVQRRGLLERILAFFQRIIAAIMNWFARAGSL